MVAPYMAAKIEGCVPLAFVPHGVHETTSVRGLHWKYGVAQPSSIYSGIFIFLSKNGAPILSLSLRTGEDATPPGHSIAVRSR